MRQTQKEELMSSKTIELAEVGSWQEYVDKMKGQHTEQYLAGDMEGYRRGWTDGAKSRPRTFTIVFVVLMAAWAAFVIGVGVSAL